MIKCSIHLRIKFNESYQNIDAHFQQEVEEKPDNEEPQAVLVRQEFRVVSESLVGMETGADLVPWEKW